MKYNNLIEYKFTLDVSGDLLSIIGFLVYLEIYWLIRRKLIIIFVIELNFCNLDYNLRKTIMEKAIEN